MGTKINNVESKNWWRYEWFELYNNTSQSISLDSWKIELYRQDLDWQLPLKGNMQPNDYFLVVSSEKISPNYDLNYSNLEGKLVNDGQEIILKDSRGNIIDSVDCFTPQKWFAGDNETKQTMERINPQLDSNNPQNWMNSNVSGGTPKSLNSVATLENEIKNNEELITDKETHEVPSFAENNNPEEFSPLSGTKEANEIYPSNIFINEILPSPKGIDEEEEWIEILNQNTEEISLYNWKITDIAGKTNIYTFPEETVIKPLGFLVLLRKTTNITLNNGGDGINLIQPNGNMLDSVSYTNALIGQSYNRTENGWVWNNVLTPGFPNAILSSSLSTKEDTGNSAQILRAGEPNKLAEKTLASMGSPNPFLKFKVFLAALILSILSGVIILFLKKWRKK